MKTPEQIVDEWLQRKCGNSTTRDDMVWMLKEARRQAFREVTDSIMAFAYQPYEHPLTTIANNIPDFKQAIKEEQK